MCVAWLLLPFLMSMNLVTVVGFVMADRVLYLSALGWCMCLVTLPRILTGGAPPVEFEEPFRTPVVEF
jgi:hypothetical protein